MCGIAGLVDLRGRTVDPALARRLCAPLAHRGPDDEGYHAEGPVALGQRRLAILDLPGGRLTVVEAADGRLLLHGNAVLVADGRLRADWLAAASCAEELVEAGAAG